MGRLINDADSIRNYYLGDSYRMQDITAKVIGPINYTVTGCDTSPMASALRPMVDAQGGPFQHYLWYYGSKNSACYVERARVGGHAASAATRHLVQPVLGCVVLVQEPGHNFGMQHSSSLDCGSAAFDRRSQRLHRQRIRRSVRSDGRRLPPHERLAEGVPGLVRRLQRRARHSRAAHSRWCRSRWRATACSSCRSRRPRRGRSCAPPRAAAAATDENLDYYYLELRTPVDFDGTLGNRRR